MSDLSQMIKCTKTTRGVDYVSIDCKLGLWGVSAPTKDIAMHQAMHYFLQYRDDGEYSSIIGGESVIEKLTKKLVRPDS